MTNYGRIEHLAMFAKKVRTRKKNIRRLDKSLKMVTITLQNMTAHIEALRAAVTMLIDSTSKCQRAISEMAAKSLISNSFNTGIDREEKIK